jgi:aminopeptidase N
MRRVLFTMLVLLLPVIIEPQLAVAHDLSRESSLFNHELRVVLDPEGRRFNAEDTITLPEAWPRTLHFSLHKGLKPVSLTPGVTADRESGWQQTVPIESYRVSLPADTRTFVLKFGGEIYHPVSPSGREAARGARDTPGIISKEGVFLSGASHWYPQFGEGLITFTLEVNVPQDWDVVSQGERISQQVESGAKRVTWRCQHPQEEIFTVAARFFEYSRGAGDVESMAFLREEDQDIADKYLAAAARYLALYDKMIGPYPYKKFALVENFWETGYGMPSFTLMGPKVIRLPFIVDSSYPHEILHNWWGNGVFADPRSGNWSEGLTAYLSDHLMQELRGTAYQYRRDALKKFASYVSREKDFPLARFRSRHSNATEAIGYGKALMFFHMLRMELGDVAFVDGLRRFYHDK